MVERHQAGRSLTGLGDGRRPLRDLHTDPHDEGDGEDDDEDDDDDDDDDAYDDDGDDGLPANSHQSYSQQVGICHDDEGWKYDIHHLVSVQLFLNLNSSSRRCCTLY